MVEVELKDGSKLEVEKGAKIIEVAQKISEGLARLATCGIVNGEVKDLRYELKEDCKLSIETFESSEEGKKAYWHTTSHIMAQAVQRLFPNVKFAIGPSIDNGFYYDFDVEKPFSDEDKANIEAEMKKIIKEDIEIERFSLPKQEALKLMEEQPYKQELIDELPEGEEISFYKQGDFTDLCAGPHLMKTGKVKAIKILSSSGAYWRGDEHNKMLQRIYAISFPKASQVDEYMQKLEETRQRDHRRIGKDLELFMTSPLVGSGLPMYLPNGATVRRLLERYIQDKEVEMGYQHVYTPSLANTELYKVSGHWDHYKEDMFPVMKMDNEEMVLRPMNCPHHMLIYKNKMHSYRDLPIRIGELAHDFRYEDSGSVCGLERVREMCQNDAHLFVKPDQIKEEFGKVVKLILSVYADFGFKDYEFRLSLRDKNNKEKYFDDDEMWEKAESQLRDILTELGVNFYEAEGEAAFYGPKLDVQLKSAVGHDVTVSTCQLDFLLPERFKLEYIGEDGEKHRPVVIHRAILGTFDRFMCFLIEETKGAFPLWLSPTQVKILPITDAQLGFAKEVEEKLHKVGIRVVLDDRNEKVGYKIREAQLEKVPYMLVIGAKEVEDNTVAVRSRECAENESIEVDKFVERVKREVENKIK
ncbi:MAG: threonine--tRNA ligase [Clostridia bacterium]|jgi:threonyl-tRNA synthetase|nr:threonine--tRNA ligase [Clostridia bacterium]